MPSLSLQGKAFQEEGQSRPALTFNALVDVLLDLIKGHKKVTAPD